MKKRTPRTTEEKLRSALNLKIVGEPIYTQKELAASLGISTRTLRRVRNQEGHKLSEATRRKIKGEVAKIDRQVTRLVDSGTAVQMVTKTIRGKKKRTPVRVKDKNLKLPKSRVKQIPVIYPSKSQASRTIAINTEGWTGAEIVEYLLECADSHQFLSWHAKVKVPYGVSRSGRKKEGDLNDEDEENEDGETRKPPPQYYMIGPFAFPGKPKIRSEILFHTDAGRKIVSIHVVQKLKRKGKK